MIDERELVHFLLHASQDQCRAAGEHLIALADAPRDDSWRYKWRKRLDELPVPTIVQALEDARRRVAKLDAEVWAAGWHPEQMRQKLVELGYTGVSDCPVPPVEQLMALTEAWQSRGRVLGPDAEALRRGAAHLIEEQETV